MHVEIHLKCSLVWTLFCWLQVNNKPMMALVHPVYDCLFRLAKSDALKNEEEVNPEYYIVWLKWLDNLTSNASKNNFQFHQKMVWRVKIIHHNFLTFSASLCLRWTVWCYSCIVLEISWRRWTCSSWMSCSICWGMDFSFRRTWAPWAACSCLRSLSFALEAGLSVKLLRNTTTAKWPTEASTNLETRRCNEISIRGNQVWRFYF